MKRMMVLVVVGTFMALGQYAWSAVILSDENFAYTLGDDEHSCPIKMLNSHATLNNLNDFAYAKCWNGYLLPKFQQTYTLTKAESRLLKFCIDVQLNMVDTLAVAALGDVVGKPQELHQFVIQMGNRQNLSDSANAKDEYSELFVKLKSNFLVMSQSWGWDSHSRAESPMRFLAA